MCHLVILLTADQFDSTIPLRFCGEWGRSPEPVLQVLLPGTRHPGGDVNALHVLNLNAPFYQIQTSLLVHEMERGEESRVTRELPCVLVLRIRQKLPYMRCATTPIITV